MRAHPARLAVLGLLLLALAWLLVPLLAPEHPVVSAVIAFSFSGGFGALMAAFARWACPEASP